MNCAATHLKSCTMDLSTENLYGTARLPIQLRRTPLPLFRESLRKYRPLFFLCFPKYQYLSPFQSKKSWFKTDVLNLLPFAFFTNPRAMQRQSKGYPRVSPRGLSVFTRVSAGYNTAGSMAEKCSRKTIWLNVVGFRHNEAIAQPRPRVARLNEN